MRQSIASIALIRREVEGQTLWLAQWNEGWQAFNFVGGHKRSDETFRECLVREIDEELGLHDGREIFAPSAPLQHLEYTDVSHRTGEETAYVVELFDVALIGSEVLPIIDANPANRWLSECEIMAEKCADGRPISPTPKRYLRESQLMSERQLHVIHLLIRRAVQDGVAFLLCPHDTWLAPDGEPYLALPTKRSVSEPFAPFLQGTSVEAFVDRVAQEDLGLADEDYVIESEIEAVTDRDEVSPSHHVPTDYTIYPIDVWVDPRRHDALVSHTGGTWLTVDAALAHSHLSPTAKAVFEQLVSRHTIYRKRPPQNEREQHQAELLRGIFRAPADQASMDALALKWFSQNRSGVRHLTRSNIDHILDAGNRAFNLRVADPYLRYQLQGLGFTWSFFTHKDKQDCHVHGAPVVEIYGILDGEMEIWWKPYYDRGTSAWNHRILKSGDWLEVDSLQCHIVHWRTPGKGIVFKAGPGPLAEVGKLGVKGKTPCKDCPCMKPPQVVKLEEDGAKS